MTELQALTKTLIQVVGSLQELITKKGTTQSSLEPESKLKKTADMTYNEFIRQALASKKPYQPSSKKASFNLQEDIQLLYDLSQHNQVSSKTFEQIISEKKIHRTADTIKNRYYDYLHKVDESQMKKIVKWVQNQGVEGYLVFEDEDLKIQLRDPKDSDKKRSRPQGHQTETKKQEKGGKSSKLKAIPTNCKQLNEVLKLYSKMVNIPVRSLVEKLDLVSGDLVQLDNYIETKDIRILWTPEEDQILKKNGAELEILKRYRGADVVETRRKYLGFS